MPPTPSGKGIVLVNPRTQIPPAPPQSPWTPDPDIPQIPAPTIAHRWQVYRRALLDSVPKLNPVHQIANPVMLVVECSGFLTLVLFIAALAGRTTEPAAYIGAVSLVLWGTLLCGNFAEALAEGRGKARAEELRRMRQTTPAKRLNDGVKLAPGTRPSPDEVEEVRSTDLKRDDLCLVEPGSLIPVDGEVEAGVALVDESAIRSGER